MNIARAYRRVASDILPGILNKFGRRPSQPKGRERMPSAEWSMAVPFRFDARPEIGKVAVVCHMYHTDMTDLIISALAAAEVNADLFISTDTKLKAELIHTVANTWKTGTVTVRVVENRGRDIAPKLITFADVYARYSLVLFLHSKRSEHGELGNDWRDYLLSCLIGSPSIVRSIQALFVSCPDVGIVTAPQFPGVRKALDGINWGVNFRKGRRLAWRMDIDLGETGLIDFPVGSMFWARPKALKPLLDLNLSFDDFPPEPTWKDGTLAHVIERLLFFSCEKAGLTWAKVVNADVAIAEQPRVEILQPSDVNAFIAEHRCDLLSAQTN